MHSILFLEIRFLAFIRYLQRREDRDWAVVPSPSSSPSSNSTTLEQKLDKFSLHHLLHQNMMPLCSPGIWCDWTFLVHSMCKKESDLHERNTHAVHEHTDNKGSWRRTEPHKLLGKRCSFRWTTLFFPSFSSYFSGSFTLFDCFPSISTLISFLVCSSSISWRVLSCLPSGIEFILFLHPLFFAFHFLSCCLYLTL